MFILAFYAIVFHSGVFLNIDDVDLSTGYIYTGVRLVWIGLNVI